QPVGGPDADLVPAVAGAERPGPRPRRRVPRLLDLVRLAALDLHLPGDAEDEDGVDDRLTPALGLVVRRVVDRMAQRERAGGDPAPGRAAQQLGAELESHESGPYSDVRPTSSTLAFRPPISSFA